MFTRKDRRNDRPTAEDRRNTRDEVFRRRFEAALQSPRIWL